MALGTLLERLFIEIAADTSKLDVAMKFAVNSVDKAAANLNAAWSKTADGIDEVGIVAARRFQELQMRMNSMRDAAESFAIAQGHAFSSLNRQTNMIDKFGRSLGQSRSQLTNLGFQLNDIGVSLASGMNPLLILIQQGSQIQQIYSGQGGGIGALFGDLGKFAVRLWPVAVAVGAIAGGLALLQREINKTSEVQVSFADTALATFQVLGSKIMGFFQPVIDFLGPILAQILDATVQMFKNWANYVVKSVQIMGVDLATVWNNFPTLVGAAITGAVNLVVDGLNAMVRLAVEGVNNLIGLLNNIPGIHIDALDESLGQLQHWGEDYNAALEDVMTERNKKVAEILASDPMGDLFSEIKTKAIENALKRIEEGTDKVGKAAKKAGEKVQKELVTPLMKAADNLAAVFGKAFEDLAETGKFTFGNFINDLNRLLISSVSDSLQKNLSTMFQGIFSSGASGGGNILGDIFTSIFGGFKAGGGPVMPWKSFVAGERGAELVNQDGPAGARRVTSAGRTRSLLAGATGSAPVSVTFNMPPGTDMTSFRRSEGQIASMIGRAVDRGRRNQ